MFGFEKRTYHHAFFTDPGDRPVNEDSIGVIEKGQTRCYILCDGLGGHGMGDAASQLVVKTIAELYDRNQDRDIRSFLKSAVEEAQQALLKNQKQLHAERKMKTTAALLVIDDKRAQIAHIGDSRVYVFGKKKVVLQTKDHSVPQMLVEAKDIKPEEIRFHPDRNILLKVMGIEWTESPLEFEKELPLRKCDAFLLCSDGFWELINETQMCEALERSTDAREWLTDMVEIVRQNGKDVNMDNYSAIAVRKDGSIHG